MGAGRSRRASASPIVGAGKPGSEGSARVTSEIEPDESPILRDRRRIWTEAGLKPLRRFVRSLSGLLFVRRTRPASLVNNYLFISASYW